MPYNKPAETYEAQLSILESRGLCVDDKAFALHCLEHFNYYRLSAYRCTLTQRGNPDQFMQGTTFAQLWGLYCFDRQLRLLVTEAVKRLEISVRAHWAYVLGHAYGAQAYENPAVFSGAARHTNALATLDTELGRSHEVFVSHFRDKYGTSRPPIWAVCEIMSFGLLSRLYENTLRIRDRKAIAKPYQLSPGGLKSLLEHTVYVRNLCAHHARLWNRSFTITVSLPQKKPANVVASLNPKQDRKLYNTLVLLAHIMNIVEPDNHWVHRVKALLLAQQLPVTASMGFPEDWESLPVWIKKPHGSVSSKESESKEVEI